MVALIEEQMHQILIQEEEDRCRRIESERLKNGENTTKPVRRTKIQKPWSRTSSVCLCQDVELLALVYEYDYDLSDSNFRRYCERRGVLYVAGVPDSRYWDYFFDHSKSSQDFISDERLRFAEEVDGKRHRFSDSEIHGLWKIVLLGRAKLQDCWEMYVGGQLGRKVGVDEFYGD